jgi:hypothetical protein
MRAQQKKKSFFGLEDTSRIEMSIPLIVILGLIYACLAVDLFLKGNTPLAVCYFSSVIGNFGAYMMVAK